MADWTKTMQQTFEYYVVDPGTWRNSSQLHNIKSSSINYDGDSQTLGSASFDIVDTVGECYIRVYLVTTQNGITEKHPLGTFLVQTPSSTFNGRIRNVTMDAYTPLLELNENKPPIGYTLVKGTNVMEMSYIIARQYTRAPVIETKRDTKLDSDFVSNLDDTWLTFLSDLLSKEDYSFILDPLGQVLFSPNQDVEKLQPVWTFNDDNSSILLPEITMNHDLYGIPNVVEAVYSDGRRNYFARVVNDDPNSPTSIVNRGREIVYRDSDANFGGIPSEAQVTRYAEDLLRKLSSIEYTITYSHGYCGTRLGDCVRLNYKRAGITDVKAKIISQSIKCEPGCSVTETAIFKNKLWG